MLRVVGARYETESEYREGDVLQLMQHNLVHAEHYQKTNE